MMGTKNHKSKRSNEPYFAYSGGKYSIRDWVIKFMPTSGHIYAEPFVGRGNVLFLSKSLNFQVWHANDLIPFLNSLQSIDLDQLPETDGHQVDRETWLHYKNTDGPMSLALEPAIAHKGHYNAGWAGRYNKTRSYNKSKYAEKITLCRELLKDVIITCQDWITFDITKYGPDDFIYIDPPYYQTDVRHYKQKFDHLFLLNTIRSINARWLLSHTYHPLYVEALGEPIARKERQAASKALSGRSEKLIECLWKGNY